MAGDVQELIAQHLLATGEGITIAAGYDLPADFKLVTDEVLMWDEVGGRYPALMIQTEGKIPEPIEINFGFEGRLPFRFVVYFMVAAPTRPASYARRYVKAIERAYMQDISRGSLADWTEPDETPNPLIWRDNGAATVFECTARGLVVYEYDPRAV